MNIFTYTVNHIHNTVIFIILFDVIDGVEAPQLIWNLENIDKDPGWSRPALHG